MHSSIWGSSTDRLAADVGMPHSGVKLHDRSTEWVLSRDANIDLEQPALIRSSGRSAEGALEVGDVITAADRLGGDLRLSVRLHVRDLLRDTAGTVGRHGERVSTDLVESSGHGRGKSARRDKGSQKITCRV